MKITNTCFGNLNYKTTKIKLMRNPEKKENWIEQYLFSCSGGGVEQN